TRHALAQALDLALALLADPARRVCVPAVRLLEVAELAAHRRVLDEVAPGALHRSGVTRERLLRVLHLLREADHGAIRLELRERQLEDLARAVPPELVDEVDGHVVGRPEARVQRIGAP